VVTSFSAVLESNENGKCGNIDGDLWVCCSCWKIPEKNAQKIGGVMGRAGEQMDVNFKDPKITEGWWWMEKGVAYEDTMRYLLRIMGGGGYIGCCPDV
jgi:hypothetical protein